MVCNNLFVYGLLRQKAQHEMGQFLSEKAQFVGEARFQGKLYLVDYYPGIVPSENPSDQVYGDLLQLKDLSILEELDHFEGVGDAYEKPNEYRREVYSVSLEGNQTQQAWVYVYNWPVNSGKEIPSGDFLKYFETR